MSSIGAISAAPMFRPAAPVIKAVDADGDHDGTTAAAAVAPKPAAMSLATSGSVGRNVNVMA